MNRWAQTFPYFLREALSGMRESRGIASLAVGTTVISLVFLGALWIVQLNLSVLIDNWSERFQLTIFLADDVTPAQRAALRKKILGQASVKRIEEISPAQAEREFRRRLGTDSGLLDGLEGGALPASVRVILKRESRKVADIEPLFAQVRVMPGVDRARNDLHWLRRLEGVIRLMRIATLTLSVLLGIGVMVIIGNTIRLTLFARREEIAIMHLVGATDLFIKTPYLTEGVLCGALGGVLSQLILWSVFHGLFRPLVERYAGADFAIQSGGWQVGAALIGIGASLGFLGSTFSVRHFLRKRR